MTGFGIRLKQLRRNTDITQRELADIVGVVPSAIGKYERLPNSYPSVEVLIKLSEYFNVTVDYLLKGVQTNNTFENNIHGQLSNSPLIQANSGEVIIKSAHHSAEADELLSIYEKLGVRERIKLLNIAIELEGGK